MSMNAGQYYIGDLCYVMHDVWDEVCDLLFPDDFNSQQGEFTLKDGRRFAIYNTNYGDGEYDTSEWGHTICVDSGTIGCILTSDIRDNTYTSEQINRMAVIKTFTEDFNTSYEYDSYEDDDGYPVEEKILNFGGIQVYT
mgnify:FL=1